MTPAVVSSEDAHGQEAGSTSQAGSGGNQQTNLRQVGSGRRCRRRRPLDIGNSVCPSVAGRGHSMGLRGGYRRHRRRVRQAFPRPFAPAISAPPSSSSIRTSSSAARCCIAARRCRSAAAIDAVEGHRGRTRSRRVHHRSAAAPVAELTEDATYCSGTTPTGRWRTPGPGAYRYNERELLGRMPTTAARRVSSS